MVNAPAALNNALRDALLHMTAISRAESSGLQTAEWLAALLSAGDGVVIGAKRRPP
jgi:hypothetical protein